MDVGRAFSYVTHDPDWLKKLLIVVVVSLVPFLSFAVIGYELEIARRTYAGNDVPLPEWDDLGDYFVRGLLATIGAFIWVAPPLLLASVVVVAAALASGDSAGAVALVLTCLLAPLTLLYLAITLPIVLARYAVHDQFGAMFALGEVVGEIRRAFVPLLMILVVMLMAQVVALVGVVACFIGVYFTLAYAGLVGAHLLGQVYRQASRLQPTPHQAF